MASSCALVVCQAAAFRLGARRRLLGRLQLHCDVEFSIVCWAEAPDCGVGFHAFPRLPARCGRFYNVDWLKRLSVSSGCYCNEMQARLSITRRADAAADRVRFSCSSGHVLRHCSQAQLVASAWVTLPIMRCTAAAGLGSRRLPAPLIVHCAAVAKLRF
jgi:hypothetical protein